MSQPLDKASRIALGVIVLVLLALSLLELAFLWLWTHRMRSLDWVSANLGIILVVLGVLMTLTVVAVVFCWIVEPDAPDYGDL